MYQLNLKPFDIDCQKCGSKITINPKDFKKDNIIHCSKCDLAHKFTLDLQKEMEKSIKKTFSHS